MLKYIITFSFSIIIVTISTFAATPPMTIVPDAIQRQQQQLLETERRQQELRNIESQSPYATGKIKPQDKAKPAAPTGNCVEIKQIAFAGNTKVSDWRIRRITRKYENRCLHVEEINTMLGA